MIYVAAILLFFLAVVSIYALISSGRNYLILFILTPLILISSIYSAYTLYSLQGTPVNGFPNGEVEVVWVELANPDILFLARFSEIGGRPVYYRIAYTEKNLEEMIQIIGQLEQGIAPQGTFDRDQDSGSDDVTFTPPAATSERPKN